VVFGSTCSGGCAVERGGMWRAKRYLLCAIRTAWEAIFSLASIPVFMGVGKVVEQERVLGCCPEWRVLCRGLVWHAPRRTEAKQRLAGLGLA
jgi:hypothetical protein